MWQLTTGVTTSKVLLNTLHILITSNIGPFLDVISGLE